MSFIEWTNWSNISGNGFFHGKNTLKVGFRNLHFKVQFGTDFIDERWEGYENGLKVKNMEYWKTWNLDIWAFRFSFWKNKGKLA